MLTTHNNMHKTQVNAADAVFTGHCDNLFLHLMQRVDSIGKDSDAGRDWGQEEKGTTEDEMAGWHH